MALGLFGLAMWAGCPYIVGPPDLSNVPPAAFEQPVVPTESADTGLVLGPGDPPVVVSSELHAFVDRIALRLELSDPEDDLVGGTITWWEGGEKAASARIPSGLDEWDRQAGVAWVTIDEAPETCDVAVAMRTVDVVVADAARHPSEQVQVEAPPIAVIDTGVPRGGRYQIGRVPLPTLVCGRFASDDEASLWGLELDGTGSWGLSLLGDDGVSLRLRSGLPDTTLTERNPTEFFDLAGPTFLNVDVTRTSNEDDALDFALWVHEPEP